MRGREFTKTVMLTVGNESTAEERLNGVGIETREEDGNRRGEEKDNELANGEGHDGEPTLREIAPLAQPCSATGARE